MDDVDELSFSTVSDAPEFAIIFVNEQSENGGDNHNRERLMLDLCVICLEQQYNAVFVPCETKVMADEGFESR
ncbi:hypothetical protein V2J09_022348 [Rumex salicifolius]